MLELPAYESESDDCSEPHSASSSELSRGSTRLRGGILTFTPSSGSGWVLNTISSSFVRVIGGGDDGGSNVSGGGEEMLLLASANLRSASSNFLLSSATSDDSANSVVSGVDVSGRGGGEGRVSVAVVEDLRPLPPFLELLWESSEAFVLLGGFSGDGGRPWARLEVLFALAVAVAFLVVVAGIMVLKSLVEGGRCLVVWARRVFGCDGCLGIGKGQ